MARPIKQNADYFSHDSGMRNDAKIKALRRKFGLTGYAIWCMILEHLTDCDNFYYDVSDLNLELLAGDFDVDPNDLREVIDYLIALNLLQNDGSTISSNTLTKRFETVLCRRITRRKGVMDDQNPSIGVVMDDQNTQSKVKESKVEKSKEDNTGVFDFFWDQYHEITSIPKTDKEPALKHWKKLTDNERNLAIEKITDYYQSIKDKTYTKKARTYLADKSFNDEHVNAEKKEEQYPDAVKMLAALGGYGPSIYPAIVKRLHEVQYKSEYGFDGILKVAVMAVENFGERGVNAYTWKAIESIDDPELRRDFRNRVKSQGYDPIHQRMVKKYLNEPAGKV